MEASLRAVEKVAPGGQLHGAEIRANVHRAATLRALPRPSFGNGFRAGLTCFGCDSEELAGEA